MVVWNDPLLYPSYKEHNLPAEYQEVTWLQSDGASILTNYYPNQNTKTEIFIDVLEQTDRTEYFLGTWGTSTTQFGMFIYSSSQLKDGLGMYMYKTSPSVYITYSNPGLPRYNTRLIMYVQNGKLAYDAFSPYGITHYVSTKSVSSFSCPYPAAIFAVSASTTGTYSPAPNVLIREVIFSEKGDIKAWFVPCYRKSDGVIGMFDLCESVSSLTNTPFYTNVRSSGTFIKGADV